MHCHGCIIITINVLSSSYVAQSNVNTFLELILTIPPREGTWYYHLQFSGEETETEILKDLTQGHSARKGQSQNLKHGTLAPRPGYQPAALCCPCMDYLKERGRLPILLTHQCSDAGIYFLPISTLPLGAEAPFYWRACDSSGPWKIGVCVWGAFRGALQKT